MKFLFLHRRHMKLGRGNDKWATWCTWNHRARWAWTWAWWGRVTYKTQRIIRDAVYLMPVVKEVSSCLMHCGIITGMWKHFLVWVYRSKRRKKSHSPTWRRLGKKLGWNWMSQMIEDQSRLLWSDFCQIISIYWYILTCSKMVFLLVNIIVNWNKNYFYFLCNTLITLPSTMKQNWVLYIYLIGFS